MKRYLRDVTSLSDAEFFNKAEELALKRYANSEEKFDSKGMYISTDTKGNVQHTFDNIWAALVESYGEFDTTDETLVLFDGGAKAIFDGYQKGFRTFVVITECLSYYAHLCGHLANEATNWADSNIYIAWYDKDTKTFTVEYMIKNNIRVNTDRTFEELKMKEKVTVLENPAYAIGGQITATVKKAWPKAKYSILMPVFQYKVAEINGCPLYTYIRTINAVGWTADTAVVADNNSIVTLNVDPDTSITYQDIQFKTFDKNYEEFYLWNVLHNIGLAMSRRDSKSDTPLADISLETDFVETGRCCAKAGGGGYGPDGYGYKWNVTKTGTETGWLHCAGVIKFKTAKQKENFSTWWYSNKKWVSLASKVWLGIKAVSVSADYYYAIPQIDWEHIGTNQKELWDAGKYDEAVLTEMGLKWEGDKIVKAE